MEKIFFFTGLVVIGLQIILTVMLIKKREYEGIPNNISIIVFFGFTVFAEIIPAAYIIIYTYVYGIFMVLVSILVALYYHRKKEKIPFGINLAMAVLVTALLLVGQTGIIPLRN